MVKLSELGMSRKRSDSEKPIRKEPPSQTGPTGFLGELENSPTLNRFAQKDGRTGTASLFRPRFSSEFGVSPTETSPTISVSRPQNPQAISQPADSSIVRSSQPKKCKFCVSQPATASALSFYGSLSEDAQEWDLMLTCKLTREAVVSEELKIRDECIKSESQFLTTEDAQSSAEDLEGSQIRQDRKRRLMAANEYKTILEQFLAYGTEIDNNYSVMVGAKPRSKELESQAGYVRGNTRRRPEDHNFWDRKAADVGNKSSRHDENINWSSCS